MKPMKEQLQHMEELTKEQLQTINEGWYHYRDLESLSELSLDQYALIDPQDGVDYYLLEYVPNVLFEFAKSELTGNPYATGMVRVYIPEEGQQTANYYLDDYDVFDVDDLQGRLNTLELQSNQVGEGLSV
jgi:hypothetical protein